MDNLEICLGCGSSEIEMINKEDVAYYCHKCGKKYTLIDVLFLSMANFILWRDFSFENEEVKALHSLLKYLSALVAYNYLQDPEYILHFYNQMGEEFGNKEPEDSGS